jgi:hypothetical protein
LLLQAGGCCCSPWTHPQATCHSCALPPHAPDGQVAGLRQALWEAADDSVHITADVTMCRTLLGKRVTQPSFKYSALDTAVWLDLGSGLDQARALGAATPATPLA